jgi:hypothetical protein
LNARTQRAMWRDGLHPDSSTWDEVVAKAEMLEIADNVLDRRDKDSTRFTPKKGWRSNNADNNHNRRDLDSASRSVTYTNRDNNDNNRSRNNNHNQTRSGSQPRQGSSSFSKKKFQRGRSSQRQSTPGGSGSAPAKSVKFADLSEKEMAQLRSEGRCFNCKDVGHLSRNCPKKNNVAGKGNNKPPGVPSYTVPFHSISRSRVTPIFFDPGFNLFSIFPIFLNLSKVQKCHKAD